MNFKVQKLVSKYFKMNIVPSIYDYKGKPMGSTQ